jgi:hypothetical protein
MKKLVFILIATLCLVSCKKEEIKVQGDYSEIPSIEFKSINTETIKEFQDSVIIVIGYKDLNGDIGQLDPDNNSLYIKDRRLPAADYYHIPPVTPEDVEFKTRGTIRIVVPTLFLLGNGGNETTVLQIKIKDQAGHWSNELSTPELTITR